MFETERACVCTRVRVCVCACAQLVIPTAAAPAQSSHLKSFIHVFMHSAEEPLLCSWGRHSTVCSFIFHLIFSPCGKTLSGGD